MRLRSRRGRTGLSALAAALGTAALVGDFAGTGGAGTSERRAGLACAGAPGAWSIGAWNQHRKSSYLQKDCPWITQLQELGHSAKSAKAAVDRLQVEYSPVEIQSWVDGYDVVAVQEADPLFFEALDGPSERRVLRGGNDRDGRGMEVESCCPLILHPDSGIEVIHQESAVLSFMLPRKKPTTVSRDLLAVLVERASDGQQLVLCSAHLHPPDFVGQSRKSYGKYLEPLKTALQAAMKRGSCRPVEMPCMILGDFNLNPEEFHERTGHDSFWEQFVPVVPEGGDSAHLSNPCARGDFALCRGGLWSGNCLGPDGFGSFERYADDVTAAAHQSISLLPELQEAQRACQAASEILQRCAKTAASTKEAMPGTRVLDANAVLDASTKLKATTLSLRRVLSRARARHRKGLLTSDHRALSFTGHLGSPALPTAASSTAAEPFHHQSHTSL